MNRLPFTKYASKALNEGREIAGYLGFKDVSSIFILLGLYGTDGSLASEVLKMHGVTRELIEEAVKEKSKMPKDRRRTVKDTPKTEYLLEIAGEACNEIWMRCNRLRTYSYGNDQRRR